MPTIATAGIAWKLSHDRDLRAEILHVRFYSSAKRIDTIS